MSESDPRLMDRICGWCALSFGAHRGSDNTCPGHEDRMDWDAGPGHTFVPSGFYGRPPIGSAASSGGWHPDLIPWIKR